MLILCFSDLKLIGFDVIYKTNVPEGQQFCLGQVNFWEAGELEGLVIFWWTGLFVSGLYVLLSLTYLFVYFLLDIARPWEWIWGHHQSADKKLSVSLLSFRTKEKL